MKRTPPQQLLFVLTCMVSGALVFGTALVTLADVYNLVTLKIAWHITIPAFITGAILLILFKSRKMKWAAASGRLLNVIKFSNGLLLAFAGAFVLLWGVALYKELYPSAAVLAARKRVAPVFNSADKRFKVLILPWEKQCEYQGKQSDIGRVIKIRFDNMASNGENINAHYLTDSIDFRNFTHKMADSIMRHHHADQILYGAYSYKECEGGTSDKICFNYITSFEDWHLSEIPAQTSYKMHDMDGLEHLREGNGAEPMDHILHTVMAISNIKQRNFVAAIEKFRQIKDFDRNENILFQMGACYYFIKDYANARIYNEKVLKINPGNIEAATHLGVSLMSEHKYEEAKSYFEKVLAYCPDDVGALLDMGRVYQALKDTVTANNYYTRILKKIHPDTEAHLTMLGYVYKDMGNYPKAKDCLEAALRLHANHADTWTSLANVYLGLKDTATAKEHLQKAIKVDPNYAEAWYRLGTITVKKNNSRQSQAYLEKAVQINPVYTDAIAFLAINYHNAGNDKKAVKCLEDALAIQPNGITPLYASFFINRDLKNYDKAKYALGILLKQNPDNLNLLNELGVICQQMNKHMEALACYKRMLKILPNNGAIYYNLASISCCLRDKKNTLNYLSKAITFEPSIKKFIAKDHSFDWLLKNKEFLAIAQ